MKIDNINKIKSNFLWKIIAFICYATITFIMLQHHEAWGDEGQAWLIGVNLPVKDIFYQMRYEGHPALWSIILKGISNIYPSFKAAQIFVWFINCITVLLVLQIEKLPLYIKLAFVFCAPMLYTYTIIARCYSLIPILLLLAIYSNNNKWSILFGVFVALIANTHVMMLGFAGIITLFLIIEAKKSRDREKLIAAIVIGISIIGVVLQVVPSFYSNTSVIPSAFSQSNLKQIMGKIREQIGMIGINILGFGISKINLAKILTSIATLTMGTILYKLSKKYATIFIVSSAFILCIFVFVVSIGATHYLSSMPKASLILLIYFYCLVMALTSSDTKNNIDFNISIAIFCVVFISTIPYGIKNLYKDYTDSISGGKEMAEVIKKEVDENDIVFTNSDITAACILTYLPDREFWFPPQNKYITFTTWNNEIKQHNHDNLNSMVSQLESENDKVEKIYFLETNNKKYFKLDDSVESLIIYKTNQSIVLGEQFILYQINY